MFLSNIHVCTKSTARVLYPNVSTDYISLHMLYRNSLNIHCKV